VRVLGVHCTAQFAYLTVVEDGQIVERGPARLAPAQCTDKDKALWETLGTFGMALDEITPDCVRLLLPGTGDMAKQTSFRGAGACSCIRTMAARWAEVNL
jgi:hypothetical protein